MSDAKISGVPSFVDKLSPDFKPGIVDVTTAFSLDPKELAVLNSNQVTQQLLLEFSALYQWGNIFGNKGVFAKDSSSLEYFAFGITKLQVRLVFHLSTTWLLRCLYYLCRN